jgi:uncharacterized membrane-anchored protein
MKVYSELWPVLFEGDNMTMNYDLIEGYIRQLAKNQNWSELITAKRRLIKYYRDIKNVNERTRRSFLEIICA